MNKIKQMKPLNNFKSCHCVLPLNHTGGGRLCTFSNAGLLQIEDCSLQSSHVVDSAPLSCRPKRKPPDVVYRERAFVLVKNLALYKVEHLRGHNLFRGCRGRKTRNIIYFNPI